MKRFTYRITIVGLVMCVLMSACNDRNNTTDSDQLNKSQDSSLTDTRRNTTDTTNYLTKDSGNQSQDVIDMDAPTNSRY